MMIKDFTRFEDNPELCSLAGGLSRVWQTRARCVDGSLGGRSRCGGAASTFRWPGLGEAGGGGCYSCSVQ